MQNVLDYPFPPVTKVDLAFPTMDTPKELVDLAKKSGFYNTGTTGE